MGAFEYQALDTHGVEQSGTLDGDSPRHIRQLLRDKSLNPVAVKAINQTQNKNLFARRYKLSQIDLVIITQQIATLIGSGLQIERALYAAGQQADATQVKHLLNSVRSKVQQGRSFAQALSAHEGVFPTIYLRTVEAGEHAGQLQSVLNKLAEYIEASENIKKRVSIALIYPAILTITALLVIIGLVTFIVPKIVQVFESMDQTLPLLTQVLISSSHFLQANGFILIALVILAVFAFRYCLINKPKFRWVIHDLSLRMPLIRKSIIGLNTARFSRTLSILIESRVPILDALNASAEVIANEPIKAAIKKAVVDVREGEPVYKALDKSKQLPPITIHLIASGEESGNLAPMLEKAARFEEKALETSIAKFLALFEPLLILLMGGLVLIIVLALLLPIFELNQLVN
ncbi:MAG: type II secretion system inner membrane protein GspF [Gammaproteobacteria bacterium]|nr:type II secretion system inner membrane protein GspF [Gammaproteobacteria bacterium]